MSSLTTGEKSEHRDCCMWWWVGSEEIVEVSSGCSCCLSDLEIRSLVENDNA